MAQRGALDVKPSSCCSDNLIHLDHDAVDLVRQLLALLFPRVAILLYLVDRRANRFQSFDALNSSVGNGLQCRPNAARTARVRPPRQQVISEKIELPRRRHRSDRARAQRPPPHCADWRSACPPCSSCCSVQFRERLSRHDDFAAHFQIAVQAEPFACRRIDCQRDRLESCGYWP